MELKGKIYCISNKINNHQYVGKTVRTLEDRFADHLRESNKDRAENRPLYNAIKKYGKENFYIELLEEVELKDIDNKEQYWISKLDTYNNGYNATIGGDGKPIYDYLLFVDDFLNGLLVKEIAQKYNCDPQTVTLGLRACGIRGKDNQIKRTSHKINQYDKNNNFIQQFSSQNEAAYYLISQGHKGSRSSICTNIGRVLKGQRKTAEGYIWRYAN